MKARSRSAIVITLIASLRLVILLAFTGLCRIDTRNCFYDRTSQTIRRMKNCAFLPQLDQDQPSIRTNESNSR